MESDTEVSQDTQWDETPRGATSGALRNLGLLAGVIWVVVTFGYALWQMTTDSGDLVEIVIVFGFWLAVALVVLSALIDRIKTLKTDRYREVMK